MNTIENLQLPDWPPIAIGLVIICIGALLCVVGVCRVIVLGVKWIVARIKKEPRERG